jgi:formylglycine-generating enzyme required for sulfatase activity
MSQTGLTGRGVGLGILTALAVFVFAWLANTNTAPAGTAQPVALEGDSFYLPEDPLFGFVEIPAGPFLMGSDPFVDGMAFENERWSEESFQGRVEVPLYYIGRYEVTVAQFRAFVAETRYPADAESLGGPEDHPVTYVSWTDALAYARWLEARLGELPDAPPLIRRLLAAGWHLGLPDEAQWEKAARGTDGRIFPWGDAPETGRANYRGTGTASVGSFGCDGCAFPLDDMSGNVWELTRSPYQPYPFDSEDDWEELDADALFVMRGGSYQDAENNVRAAVRGGVDPGARRAFIGFRLVLSAD